MSRLPSNRRGQSFIEYVLIIILFAIVLLSILLILGDDLRTFINDLLQTWFPAQSQSYVPIAVWFVKSLVF
jgi:Flp pilus assembly pilin Flp